MHVSADNGPIHKIEEVGFYFRHSGQKSYPVAKDPLTQELVSKCLRHSTNDLPSKVSMLARLFPKHFNAAPAPEAGNEPLTLLIASSYPYAKVRGLDLRKRRSMKVGREKRTFRVVFFEGNRANIRHLTKDIYDLIQLEPTVLVLGIGMLDFGISEEAASGKIEIDDFTIRLSWLLGKLKRETRSQLIWAHVPLLADGFDRTGKFRLTVQGDKEYSQRAESVCQQESVAFVRLEPTNGTYDIPQDALLDALKPSIDRALETSVSLKLEHAPEKHVDNRIEKAVIKYSDGHEVVLQDPQDSTLLAARLDDYCNEEVISTIRLAGTGLSLHAPGGRIPFEQSRQRQIMDWLRSQEQPGLKRAMILGDSVFMRLQSTTGYCLPCYKLLVGSFNLTHVPHHIGGSRSVVRNIDRWLSCNPRVVHLNTGLHDLTTLPSGARFPAHVPVEQYIENLQAIINIIREHKVEHVIWGTCTPLNEEKYAKKIVRRMVDIRRYNDAANSLMKKNNIEVNDLFTPLIENDGLNRYYQKDGGHLNEDGSNLVAQIVANKVLQYV